MGSERHYMPEEVTAIVASALRRHRDSEAISHEVLLETAAELGIPRDAIEEAARHLSTERDMELARRKWLTRQRREFHNHLVSYVIVNAFLTAVDFAFSGGVWFYLCLGGWGIGLAFHAYSTFFPDPEEVEKGARKILAKERQKNRVMDLFGFGG